MLSPIKIIVISSALINTPKVEPQPIIMEENYSVEAAKYLRTKQNGSDIISKINDIMYGEILKELESQVE